jgi:serine/threonine protein kinase
MYSLDHQNIIRLFNHFEEEEFIYLVLEFAENGQLYEKLQKEGPINKNIVQSYL